MKKIIILLLIMGIIIELSTLSKQKEGFEILPIFTPVSLQYEKELRQGKASIDIQKVMKKISALEKKPSPNIDKQKLRKIQKHRKTMLDLRNERHALNVQMMENGIELLSVLTPEQWDFVQSNRDQIQKKVEMEMLERLLQK